MFSNRKNNIWRFRLWIVDLYSSQLPIHDVMTIDTIHYILLYWNKLNPCLFLVCSVVIIGNVNRWGIQCFVGVVAWVGILRCGGYKIRCVEFNSSWDFCTSWEWLRRFGGLVCVGRLKKVWGGRFNYLLWAAVFMKELYIYIYMSYDLQLK